MADLGETPYAMLWTCGCAGVAVAGCVDVDVDVDAACGGHVAVHCRNRCSEMREHATLTLSFPMAIIRVRLWLDSQ